MPMNPTEALAMLVREISGYTGPALERAVYGVIGAAHAFQAIGAIDMHEAILWGERARLAGVRKGWSSEGLTEEILVKRIQEAASITPAPSLDSPLKPGETRRAEFPDSMAGIQYTLGRMIKMIQEARKDPLVIATARKIAALTPPGDCQGGCELHWLQGIHAWCRANFVFVNDPVGIELIQTPNRMLRELEIPPQLHRAMWHLVGKEPEAKMPAPKMTGDADEATIISLSLAASIGIEPLRIRLGGTEGVAHTCWGQAHVDGRWVDCDILHEQFGKHQEVRVLEDLDVPL